jgi:hypothetical protein
MACFWAFRLRSLSFAMARTVLSAANNGRRRPAAQLAARVCLQIEWIDRPYLGVRRDRNLSSRRSTPPMKLESKPIGVDPVVIAIVHNFVMIDFLPKIYHNYPSAAVWDNGGLAAGAAFGEGGFEQARRIS